MGKPCFFCGDAEEGPCGEWLCPNGPETESIDDAPRTAPWTRNIRRHEIGPYSFIEFEGDGGTEFSIHVDGQSVGRIAPTLDAALAEAMAIKHDGPNSQAGRLFMRMIQAI